jgi:hypothetical protein
VEGMGESNCVYAHHVAANQNCHNARHRAFVLFHEAAPLFFLLVFLADLVVKIYSAINTAVISLHARIESMLFRDDCSYPFCKYGILTAAAI